MNIIQELNIMSPLDLEGMTINDRRRFIKMYMSLCLEDNYFCPALHDYVYINNRSINETSTHAAKSVLSTLGVINLPSIIRNASVIKIDTPKSGSQTKKFRADSTILLKSQARDNIFFKLAVIRNKSGYHIHYCVTGYEGTDYVKMLLQNAYKQKK